MNNDEIPDNGIDDDNNGFVDDTYGWDFTGEYDNIPQDEHGHGTHVAGTIGATRNNNEGIAGVADNVKIMGLRFLDKQLAKWNNFLGYKRHRIRCSKWSSHIK